MRTRSTIKSKRAGLNFQAPSRVFWSESDGRPWSIKAAPPLWMCYDRPASCRSARPGADKQGCPWQSENDSARRIAAHRSLFSCPTTPATAAHQVHPSKRGMRLAAFLVLHTAAAKKSRRWCGAQGLEQYKRGIDRDQLEGWGVLLLGTHATTYRRSPLAESMRSKTRTLVITAAERNDALDELCSRDGAHCVGDVPLRIHQAAAVVSIDHWDFSRESGHELCKKLRELMHPEGRLLIATTNNAT